MSEYEVKPHWVFLAGHGCSNESCIVLTWPGCGQTLSTVQDEYVHPDQGHIIGIAEPHRTPRDQLLCKRSELVASLCLRTLPSQLINSFPLQQQQQPGPGLLCGRVLRLCPNITTAGMTVV